MSTPRAREETSEETSEDQTYTLLQIVIVIMWMMYVLFFGILEALIHTRLPDVFIVVEEDPWADIWTVSLLLRPAV